MASATINSLKAGFIAPLDLLHGDSISQARIFFIVAVTRCGFSHGWRCSTNTGGNCCKLPVNAPFRAIDNN